MIGIIGAMEEEVTLLRNDMTDATTDRVACFDFYRGKLEGREAVLLQCGIGKVQAAAGCATLVTSFAPSVIINTGCAGGINPSGTVPLYFGDAVISTALVQHDLDLTAFGYKPGQVPGRDTAEFVVDKELISRAEKAVAELKFEKKLPENFKAVPGLIASGDAFISDSKTVFRIEKTFPGVRAVEMEGAAIAHVCAIFNVRCIVLRCLSDIAGEESPVKFDEYLPIAAKNSSEMVKRMILRGL